MFDFLDGRRWFLPELESERLFGDGEVSILQILVVHGLSCGVDSSFLREESIFLTMHGDEVKSGPKP